MSPLVILITIQTTDIRERTVLVHLHFIYGTDAATFSFPHHLIAYHSITYHFITLSSCLGKSVFAQRLDFGLIFCSFLKLDNDTATCYDILIGCQS